MEEDETFDEDTPVEDDKDVADEDEEDEAFTRGYANEDDIDECSECGIALRKKKITKVIESEEYAFCSEECAKDFEESMAKSEE